MDKDILRVDCCESSNSLLRAMVQRGEFPHRAILAARQSGGRGRQGRSFASPEGGLYLSYLYCPASAPASPGELTASAALAVCRALEGCGIFPCIKWVNDLLLEGKKICGILCEALPTSQGMAYIIGIGVNVNTPPEDFPQELRHIAGSIFGCTGRRLDIDALAQAILQQLDSLPFADGFEQYRLRCITLGKEVSVSLPDKSYRAYARELERDFSLSLRLPDGREENLSFGEVSIRI